MYKVEQIDRLSTPRQTIARMRIKKKRLIFVILLP